MLAAVPLLGSPFKKDTLAAIAYDFGECAAALVGGAAAMDILPIEESDSTEARFGKSMLNMGIGMGAAKISYNLLCSGGALLYQYAMYASTAKNSEVAPSTELQALNRQHLNGS